MPDKQSNKAKDRAQRARLTVELTYAAEDAIYDIRRKHKRATGKDKPKWKVIDEAVRDYAEQQGIEVED